jgi:prevent-host-death family protein
MNLARISGYNLGMEFSVQQAKNQLSRLLQLAEKGESVIISRHGKPVVQLSPVLENKRILGAEAHLEPFPGGWEAPLSKKEADAFLKSRR